MDTRNPAAFSKHCTGYIEYPGVSTDLDKLKNLLVKIRKRFRSDPVLYPTTDILLLNVGHIAQEIGEYSQTIPDLETLSILVEKKKFYKSLIESKVPHPKTLFVHDYDVVENIDELQYPVYLKPSVSQVFARRFGKKGFVANDERELAHYLKIVKENLIEVILQEIVPGLPDNHYFLDGYIDKNLETMALFARRRLRMWPFAFGNSTSCISVPLAEIGDMKVIIVNYLKSIKYHGIFSAEFKRDHRDGQFKILEVNARGWWYNTFPTACGVNIILLSYLDAIGESLEPIKEYDVGTNMLYFNEDLKWQIAMISKGKLSLRELYSSLQGKVDWTIMSREDYGPYVASVLYTIDGMLDREKIASFVRRAIAN